MKLLGSIASPYVARVLMFARIKGVELPSEPAPGGSLKSDEYLALNPIGKIPSLVVGDQCIAESEVICEYIEDMHPEPSGLPADPMGRAQSRLISRITDFYLGPKTGVMFGQMNPATRDQEIIDTTAAEIRSAFGYAEHFMGDGPFCVGAKPTLGDCAFAPYVMLLQKAVFPIFAEVDDPTQGDGRIATWWQAIQNNDVCMSTLDEYGAAIDKFMKGINARLTGQKT